MLSKKGLPLLSIFIGSLLLVWANPWAPAAVARPSIAETACAASPSGMVSWWPGDGNANDTCGGNDGVLLNGATFANGKVGQAFSFDGVNDGVLVNNTSSLNFEEGADFSLAAWIRVNPDAVDPQSNLFTILSKRYAPIPSAVPIGFELFLFEGRLGFQLADDNNTLTDYQNYFSTSPDLRDGNFHHVAVTVNRDMADGGRLFVDGEVILTFDPSFESGDLSTTEPLRIGIHATDGFDAFFDGRIDEIKIFDRALSPAEVEIVCMAGIAGECGDSTIYLPLVIAPCQGRYLDSFGNSGSGWPIENNSTNQIEYLGAEYRILVKSTDSWAGARPGVKASSFRVSVDVRNAVGTEGSYGIIFGLAEDWSQFYTFEIDPTGEYFIWRYDNGSWTVLKSDSSNQLNMGTASNRLQVERNGSQIKAFANGQLLATLTDSAFTGERNVGLITSTFEQANVDARFDNFELCSFAGPLNSLEATQKALSVPVSQSSYELNWSISTGR